MLTSTDQQVSLGKKIQAHIELADPVTWISPSIVCLCGSIASGYALGFNMAEPRHWALALLGALMAGPLGTGFSQSINDYYDRELDAINDPARPIPAGLVTLQEARLNWILLGLATVGVSLVFGNPWIVLLAVLGIILSVIYSVPPIKLKKTFLARPARSWPRLRQYELDRRTPDLRRDHVAEHDRRLDQRRTCRRAALSQRY